MIEVKKRKEQKAAEPKSAPPSQPSSSSGTSAGPKPTSEEVSSNEPPRKRVQRGHRKQIEALKRKIAKRAKPP